MSGEGTQKNDKLNSEHLIHLGNGVYANKLLLEREAELWHGKIQCKLAVMYWCGKGVKRNYAKAHKLFIKAAKEGCAIALRYLGMMHFRGDGVERDYAKALNFFQQAIAEGDIGAFYNLGLMYYHGFGVEKDLVRAREFFRRAAFLPEQIEARFCFGLMCCQAEGGALDLKSARKFLLAAACKGEPRAQFTLGCIYRHGLYWAKQNFKAAHEFLKRAAYSGIADADFERGLMFKNGEGCDKDPVRAYKLFVDAAEKGSNIAKTYLASLKIKASA